MTGKAFWLALASLSCAAPAAAQQRACALEPGQESRLGSIQEDLRAEAHRARIWAWSWGLGWTAATVGQLVPIPFVKDSGLRADLAVGAATSAVGALFVVAMPPEVIADSRELDRALVAPDADRCALLPRAEGLLRAAAEDEALGTGPWMHAANAGLNIAAGLVLGLGYHRWGSGTLTAASGIALGEVMILTQPTSLQKRVASPLASIALSPGGVRLGLAVAF